jgi:hypothetical protein
MPRELTATVHCFCGRLVTVRQRRQGPGLLAALGAVCDCGRGIDLAIETEPASEPTGFEYSCLARFSDVFLRAFEQRLAGRPRPKPAVRPPPKVLQLWPAQFPSREAWLAFCERDRQAEAQERMEATWSYAMRNITPRSA